MRTKKTLLILFGLFILGGCAVVASHTDFTKLYGDAQPRDRVIDHIEDGNVDFWKDVKPVLDNRCVVCHGCYDAACQLKLTAMEGIERGAHKVSVYNTTRITSANMTRLFEDGHSVEDWRNLNFFPVLNEHTQSPAANREAGVMYRLLKLKQQNPLPNTKILGDEFTFGLNRKESCPTPSEIDTHIAEHPQWGMPYALPALNSEEQTALEQWLEEGALYTERPPLTPELLTEITKWETLFNQDSLKDQLANRYIYEHLFLGHLYFEDVSDNTFFKLVRSKTPPGELTQPIATRRPYDNPETERVYYRFMPVLETIVAKNHMPYALNSERMTRWQSLFYKNDFSVSSLPSYGTKEGGNPFVTFAELPMESRYKFMLDEAQFTIMNYIKGPVCRGGVALNVINDRFWVFFVDPDIPQNDDISAAVDVNKENLELPSVQGDIYVPLIPWKTYAARERKNRDARDAFMVEHFADGKNPLDLSLVWDGDGVNKNAALTILRHYDSATVEKGLIGDNPKTAWIIGYPLLERIHYLLVAGYDVYGNLGHNLLSRLHMDFLRMDGESAFLTLLPQETREKERKYWYREAKKATLEYLKNPEFERVVTPSIEYKTSDHKAELFDMLKEHLGSALDSRHSIDHIGDSYIRGTLSVLADIRGEYTVFLPEASVLEIVDQQAKKSVFVTMIKNVGHLNITAILSEKKMLRPKENTLTLAKGFIGTYPNAFFKIDKQDLSAFVEKVSKLRSVADYTLLADEFAVRRTNTNFWEYSDHIHEAFRDSSNVEFGMFDYNRLENR